MLAEQPFPSMSPCPAASVHRAEIPLPREQPRGAAAAASPALCPWAGGEALRAACAASKGGCTLLLPSLCPMDPGPADEWCTAGATGYCSAELTHPNPPSCLFQEQGPLTQLLCLCCKSTFCHFINEDKIICCWDGKMSFFLALCQQRPNYVVWFKFCFFSRKKAQKTSVSLFLII